VPSTGAQANANHGCMPPVNCPNCAAPVPEGAHFCSECGVRLVAAPDDVTAVEQVPPEETGEVPVNMVTTSPRYFGVAPPLALIALAAASLVLGIVFLVAGRIVAGALLLVAAGLFSVLVAASARRLAQTPAARVTGLAYERVRERAGFVVEAVTVHSKARSELLRLRHELLELAARRAEAARALGEAVYGGSEDEVEEARNRMSELDRALADKEREMTTVAAEANERLQRAHLRAQPTAVVEPPGVPEPMPVPSEPPYPVTVPEPSPIPSEPPVPSPSPDPAPEPSPPEPESPPQGR
jgi:outer membrane biosynthesis protein TonB